MTTRTRAERERDEARAEADASHKTANHNWEVANRLTRERDEARALLRELEWVRVDPSTFTGDTQEYEFCPSCLADRQLRGTHTSWCALAAALKEP